ncbi:MAG: hypothetical protein ATN35_05230 [Epulopiscium sp. Nele67-Bin004]|nr:MAG: hypothetical protein ATN35_05230 [Epulopiscium sp. Nele67-Bin004]
MKYLRFSYDNTTYLGVSIDDTIYNLNDIPQLSHISTLIDLIKADISNLKELVLQTPNVKTFLTSEITYLSPIEKPIHDVVCVGLNYKSHYEECAPSMPLEAPTNPVYFSKRTSRILGPYEDIPFIGEVDDCFDYEVELAVIISKTGRDIQPDEVEDYIFGYSIYNDLSARTLQKRHQQWYRGKSLDNSSVMGPVIVDKSEIAYPPVLNLTSKVNDEVRQNNSTSNFIFTIEDLIVDFSKGCTLEAGDIIITGTPEGVGMGFTPPKYLKVGDTISCEIENIGTISNKIV